MADKKVERPSEQQNIPSRDLRYLPRQIAIPRIRRDVQKALAVTGFDPGLDGDDLARTRRGDGAGDRAAFGEQLEVLVGGVYQGAAAGIGLVDRLPRRSTPSPPIPSRRAARSGPPA